MGLKCKLTLRTTMEHNKLNKRKTNVLNSCICLYFMLHINVKDNCYKIIFSFRSRKFPYYLLHLENKIMYLLLIISIWHFWSLESFKIFSGKRLKKCPNAENTKKMSVRFSWGRVSGKFFMYNKNNECFLRKK